MNRILDFSEDLAYVTIEPGVTQAQLFAFLREQRSKLWMDATGASPECSLIGNAVESGFGHTPYGDHFANSCGLEVVLPNGEVIDTGFARFPGAHAAPAYRWGVGPSLDGMFSQSNFGIVTRMTQWLMPAPEYFQAYYFRCDKPEDVTPLEKGDFKVTLGFFRAFVFDLDLLSKQQVLPLGTRRRRVPHVSAGSKEQRFAGFDVIWGTGFKGETHGCRPAARIARYLGVGRTTIERAEAVVEAAEEEPDERSIPRRATSRQPRDAKTSDHCG